MGNKAPMTPTFKDAMDNFARQVAYGLYCHLPGAIVSFDRSKGTAKVAVGLKQLIPDYTAQTGFRLASYPQLNDVPVFMLQGSGGSVGADPAAGDPCLICVMDRNIDAWYQNGGVQAPLSARAHDLSDAFCFVGFNPISKPLMSAREAGECGIADAAAAVVVKNGKASIRNQADGLKAFLQDLITQIENVNTGIIADSATVPNAASAATLANAQLVLLLTRLGLLLY